MIETKFTPQLLTDKSRLQEIYDLRVEAWENSPYSNLINKKKLPNGWKDHLDDEALHWVVFNDSFEIVASARLNIIDSIERVPLYKDFSNVQLPNRFAYISRLVVKPEYRKLGLSFILDSARIKYAITNSIEVIIGIFSGHRIENLKEYGFITKFSFTDTLLPSNTSGILSAFMVLDLSNINHNLIR